MELPDGRTIPGFLSLEHLRERYAEYPLPPDLTGRRALDLGTWDGWFAFEMERRGAEVVAADLVEQDNFRYAHRERASRIQYVIANVYDLPDRGIGKFDYVLFLGVLYHLRHPLLALERVCELTREVAIVDSFVVLEKGHVSSPIPWMEFYETEELAGQLDNWCGPTLECLFALCRSAGFVRVEKVGLRHEHATLACYRRWAEPPDPAPQPPPRLLGVANGLDHGVNFASRGEQFVTCWFESPEELSREALRPEAGGFGAAALTCRREESVWKCSFKLPPGLQRGWADVRIRTARSHFSNAISVPVDQPAVASGLSVLGASDGRSWTPGRVEFAAGDREAFLAVWLAGTAANCDRANLRAYLGDAPMITDFVCEPAPGGQRQVNFKLARRWARPGRYPLRVVHGGLEAGTEIEVCVA